MTTTQARTAETAAGVVTEFFDRYRAHDVNGMADLCSINADFAYVPVEMWGKQRVLRGDGKVATIGKPLWTGLINAFPDLLVTTGRVITTGDVVTALVKVEGTQAGAYAGAINQEKHLDIDQAWRFTVTGALITGVSAYWCQRQLYRRLAVKRFDAIAIA